jgi:hypothetical protein
LVHASTRKDRRTEILRDKLKLIANATKKLKIRRKRMMKRLEK